MNRLAISGIGIVCPRAFGREAFVRALPGSATAESACRVPDFALEEYLESARLFRRVAGATKFALAAMALAVSDTGFSAESFGGERVGLIVAIVHGAVPYSVQFHRTLVLEGPLSASPLHLPNLCQMPRRGTGPLRFRSAGRCTR
jgi:hypothetical protein